MKFKSTRGLGSVKPHCFDSAFSGTVLIGKKLSSFKHVIIHVKNTCVKTKKNVFGRFKITNPK